MRERILTAEEAHRIANGLVTVTPDPVDPSLWQVEAHGIIETHEPMTEPQWRDVLNRYAATLAPVETADTQSQDYDVVRIRTCDMRLIEMTADEGGMVLALEDSAGRVETWLDALQIKAVFTGFILVSKAIERKASP